ncbi:DeoR/GlpR transcriptional regulator, partial [Serratia marcescens]
GERWLVADHMKLDRCEPHHVADLAQIQRLFTDRPWDKLDEQSLIELCVVADDR